MDGAENCAFYDKLLMAALVLSGAPPLHRLKLHGRDLVGILATMVALSYFIVGHLFPTSRFVLDYKILRTPAFYMPIFFVVISDHNIRK